MKPISRRTVLRGLGTAMALPWLEAMAPAADLAAKGVAAAATTAPRRMAFFYVPNGVRMSAWRPEGEGADFKLPEILRPLEGFRDSLNVLTGLTQDGGRAHGDGPGDHARSMASFLTGKHPLKTNGFNIKAGVSVDQVAAKVVGKATRFPSLELGIDRGALAGSCDSGYSCAYSANISWRSESTPMAKEINPQLVFERLFADQLSGLSPEARSIRERRRRSVLDFVAEDARQLRGRLGKLDRGKVDEYLTSVRELEQRIARSEKEEVVDLRGIPRPDGIPQDNREHIRLMFDILALAFQTDVTRISTFAFANEGSTKSYKFIGVPEGHHDLSHHGRDPEKLDKLQKINTYHIEQFAYFLDKLRNSSEGDSNVLDNSMIVYGSGLSDGDRHNHDDLPVLLLGKGGGTIPTGRHLVYPKDTPLNNLYLSMLGRVGVDTPTLGDGAGPLDRLDG
ncbi:DUF1552 domain-containing protein [Tundrisphaera sp. TA3]|uniref:DUF1552 domain-containing protein n=1 Tax=Tundrisphaera sp. TA3 TaxID=3435775 RepID=UPI003EBC1E00